MAIMANALQTMRDPVRDQLRWVKAEAKYRKAISLNPNEIETNSQYAQMLTRVGKGEEALQCALKAAELDSLSPVNSRR